MSNLLLFSISLVSIFTFIPKTDLKLHIKENILTTGPSWNTSLTWYDYVSSGLRELIGPLSENLPDFINVDEDDIIIRMLASFTPILGKTMSDGQYLDISQECSDASWTYLINMIKYNQGWAFQSKYSYHYHFHTNRKLP